MAWTNVVSAAALSPCFLHEVAVAARPSSSMIPGWETRARMAARESSKYATLAGPLQRRCRIARIQAVLPLPLEAA